MKHKHQIEADALTKAAREMGYRVDYSTANTGTVYLACEHDNGVLKIRCADHGECHCSEDFSVDPDGVTLLQAANRLAELAGCETPAWVASFDAEPTYSYGELMEMWDDNYGMFECYFCEELGIDYDAENEDFCCELIDRYEGAMFRISGSEGHFGPSYSIRPA